MANKQSGKRTRRVPRTVLRLPDLDQAKSAVLVLLRASTLVQQGCRPPISHPPGLSASVIG